MVEDRDTSRALYDAGLLDVVGVGPRDAAERETLLARPDVTVTLGTCTRYVGFNVQRPPFDDPNVRMAFAKAIDRDEYVRDVAIGTHPAPSFVTHDFPGHTHTDRTQDFDANEARRLLAASKYGSPVDGKIGGIDLRFTFTVTAALPSATRTRVEWLIAQWRANLGVAVRADPVDTTTYGGGLVKKPEAQPLLRDMSWCADYPDGEAWYSDFTKDGPAARALSFDDPEYDAIVARARSETDPLARERIYDGASYRLSQQAPGAWLYWSQYWTLVDPKVSGYTLSSFDWDFSQFALTRIVGVRR
jgi:oligopeptide transport system substrate-binding protein